MRNENILNTASLARALKLAQSQVKRGHTEAAKAIYTDILQRFPKNTNALQGLDDLLSGSASGSAMQLNADPPEGRIQNLIDLHSQGNLQEALEHANELIARFSDSAVLHNILGAVYAGLKDHESAIENYQKALKIKPDSAEMHNNLGNALQNLGDLDGAVESYRKALNINPIFAEAHNNFGNALQELGSALQEGARVEEAEASYRRAIELKPDYAAAHSNLGSALQELGKLEDAEASCRRAIVFQPDFAEAHSNLGNALQELGRPEEAEASYRKVIVLKPDFAEAHSNLGNALKELGRLEEAEESYSQAIGLKPDFAEAHNNLGVTLKNMGRPEEAEASHRQAILLNFDYAEARNNLGNALQALGRLEEAETSYSHAIGLKHDYAEAHNNLGVTLQKLGRLEEAETSYRQAISLKSDYAEAIMNLSIVLAYASDIDEAIQRSESVMKIDAENSGLRAAVNLAIFKFLENDLLASQQYLKASSRIQEKLSLEYKNEVIYWGYLQAILNWHQNKQNSSTDLVASRKLYVLGESHALVSHTLNIQYPDGDVLCESLLIKGCKQWHLGSLIRNQYKNKFESAFQSLPKSSDILLVFGEIDCRLDNGILKYKTRFPETDIKELVVTTVKNYLTYVVNKNLYRRHNVTIQGVPCPNINIRNTPKEEVFQLIELIKMFNFELKIESEKIGFDFLDVHKLTDRGDGFSNSTWHIDDYHLSPEAMMQAWSEHFASMDLSPGKVEISSVSKS